MNSTQGSNIDTVEQNSIESPLIQIISDEVDQKVDLLLRYYQNPPEVYSPPREVNMFRLEDERVDGTGNIFVYRRVYVDPRCPDRGEHVQTIQYQDGRVCGIASRREGDFLSYNYHFYDYEDGVIINVFAQMDMRGNICTFKLKRDGTCVVDEKGAGPSVFEEDGILMVRTKKGNLYPLDKVISRTVNPWPTMGVPPYTP